MVLEKPGPIDSSPLKLRERGIPEPRGNEICVRVEACGVCRTDLHVVEADLPFKHPIVPGHQTVGIVDAAGPEAKRFKIGDRVGIAWLRYTCGQCEYCRAGKENLCPNARFSGWDEDGGYAEYAVVREDYAYAISKNLDAAEATPLLCAGIIGYRSLKRADVKPGCRLGLFGFGSSAHIAIQVAKYRGCRVFVMTRDTRHQQLARELGADWVGGSSDSPPEKLNSAILFAPVGTIVPAAMEALDMGGTLAIAGIHLSDVPPLNYERHLFHERNLRSVTANTREDGEELMRLAEEIPLRPHVTRFQLSEANVALRNMKNDQINGTAVLMTEK